jgi:hypothetical protein
MALKEEKKRSGEMADQRKSTFFAFFEGFFPAKAVGSCLWHVQPTI